MRCKGPMGYLGRGLVKKGHEAALSSCFLSGNWESPRNPVFRSCKTRENRGAQIKRAVRDIRYLVFTLLYIYK